MTEILCFELSQFLVGFQYFPVCFLAQPVLIFVHLH